MSDYYVVVCKNDQPSEFDEEIDEDGEIVFEMYLKDASIEGCERFIKRLNGKYGKCRIAKLTIKENQ